MTLEDKRDGWTKKWGSDDFDPDWELKSFPESIRELIEDGLLPDGTTVVDIGCGSGYLAAKLAEKAYQVTAFDFAETAIEKARKNYPEGPGLKYYVADATAPLPFIDTFRIGIDRGTLHTLPMNNHPDYVKNISPIIESDGLLIIIYAEQIARKLSGSPKDNHGDSLKDHIFKLFEQTFNIIDFENIMIQSQNKDDVPGFLIILRRNGEKISGVNL